MEAESCIFCESPSLTWGYIEVQGKIYFHEYFCSPQCEAIMMAMAPKCSYCGDALSIEEICNPYMDGQDIMCYGCYNEHFEATCPMCEDYFTKSQGADKFLFLVPVDLIRDQEIETDELKPMVPGIYKANRFPIYTSDMFTEWFEFSNIELYIAVDMPGDLAGEICPDCIEEQLGLGGKNES